VNGGKVDEPPAIVILGQQPGHRAQIQQVYPVR
jgi:hypothetical protein